MFMKMCYVRIEMYIDICLLLFKKQYGIYIIYDMSVEVDFGKLYEFHVNRSYIIMLNDVISLILNI